MHTSIGGTFHNENERKSFLFHLGIISFTRRYSVWEAGCSVPSGSVWNITAPSPYAEASPANITGRGGS